jgi:hypothetical protein
MEDSLAFAPCQNHIEISSQSTLNCLSDDALEAVLVPLDDLDGVDLVGCANLVLATPAAGDTLTGTGPKFCQLPPWRPLCFPSTYMTT